VSVTRKDISVSSKSNGITGDGVEYVRKDSVAVSDEPKNSNIRIVVLQRGWVMIGRYSEDGDMCKLENAYVIRRWGTEKGLGQLALEGKQEDTTLDKAGVVDFHKLTIVATLKAKEELWHELLV
jgi:hypothetical protein